MIGGTAQLETNNQTAQFNQVKVSYSFTITTLASSPAELAQCVVMRKGKEVNVTDLVVTKSGKINLSALQRLIRNEAVKEFKLYKKAVNNLNDEYILTKDRSE